MHLDVQLTNMVECRHTLQPWGHIVQVRRDSVPLQPCRLCLSTVKYFIPGGDVLHALLHMSRHFAHYAMVLVHGVASAAAQSLGYLLWQLGHLEDGRKAREPLSRSAVTFAPIYPTARGDGCSLLAFD